MIESPGAAEFRRRLDIAAADTERMLDQLLRAPALPGEVSRPPRLLDAMRYSALEGGKRLRPFLLIETARMFGVEGERPLRAGAALEMIHCYSLVHDDLPAMDDDGMRRGRPTTHKAFDEATAILAGDALLTMAFDILADVRTHDDATIRADLVVGLARASGVGGMAGGQALDLEAERAHAPHTTDTVMHLQSMKTGALLLWAVEGGARLGGADAGQIAHLSRYGRALGACFQVADDILDAEGDEAALGKRAGKDSERNKATLVGALGLDKARERRDLLAIEAIEALDAANFGEASSVLAEAARFTAARRS